MKITFQPAAVADAEALLAIQIRAFRDDARLYPGVEPGGPPGYDSHDELIKDITERDYTVILVDGRIVGGMTVFDCGGGHFHLDRIYIDPDYHNQGIGAQALAYLEARYPATKWTLDTPTWATRNHHFYEKHGYRKVGERMYDILLVCYEKQIVPAP